MATIDEVQRKYIRQRLTELRNQKLNEIKSRTQSAVNRSKNSQERHDYIISELARVGLNWTFDRYGELVTTFDIETDKLIKEQNKLAQTKTEELNTLFHELMDKLILGEDSSELVTLLTTLNDFNTGEVI